MELSEESAHVLDVLRCDARDRDPRNDSAGHRGEPSGLGGVAKELLWIKYILASMMCVASRK